MGVRQATYHKKALNGPFACHRTSEKFRRQHSLTCYLANLKNACPHHPTGGFALLGFVRGDELTGFVAMNEFTSMPRLPRHRRSRLLIDAILFTGDFTYSELRLQHLGVAEFAERKILRLRTF